MLQTPSRFSHPCIRLSLIAQGQSVTLTKKRHNDTCTLSGDRAYCVVYVYNDICSTVSNFRPLLIFIYLLVHDAYWRAEPVHHKAITHHHSTDSTLKATKNSPPAHILFQLLLS